MLRTVLKSKIHRARVTEANVDYAGSITIDAERLKAADLVPYEQVHVLDVNTGARIVTYCIEGPVGSGMVCVNGAAARLVSAGDLVIIVAYAQVTAEELEDFRPRIVLLDAENHIQQVMTQAAHLSEGGDLETPFNL